MMDMFSNGHEIASTMGQLLRSFSEAGCEPKKEVPTQESSHLTVGFEELVTDARLRQASEALYHDGHYARAVEEAFKCLNNAVKNKSGIGSKDGSDLMKMAFSAHSPTLKLSESDSSSARNEQLGYMEIFSGSMTGIRNPRAHDDELADEPDVALELLVLANHLMRKLNLATKSESKATRQ